MRIPVVLALLLAACQPNVEPVQLEDLFGGDDPAPADGQQPGQDQPGQQEPGQAQPPPPSVDDRAGLGGMCRAYLRGDVPALVVEVSSQAGAAPDGGAVEHLLGVLRSVVDKPAGVSLVTREIPGGAQTWTRPALQQLSEEHRVNDSTSELAVMHVLALRGEYENPDVLGVAFDASTFALFPDRIGGLAALLGGTAALERALLVHEAGHLLCLVNISYTSEIDHESADHPHHSADEASVMYWAVETSAVATVFSGPPPADFTANDRADLDGLRSGRY